MNWLMWRQHRKQLLFAGTVVVLYATVLVILGTTEAHLYHQALAKNDQSFTINGPTRYMPLATIVLPLLFGMFWGAPLIAKEYEQNTNKFIWTQGISRRKWLASKLGWMMGFAALYGAIISASVMWCMRPELALMRDRFEWVHFDVIGAMPIMYAIFAVALGAAIGAWRKQVVSALAITLTVFVVVQGAFGIYLRKHYATPYAVSSTSTYSTPAEGGEGTLLRLSTTGTPMADNDDFWNIGDRMTTSDLLRCTKVCISTNSDTITYQPGNRFWKFQVIESVIYLGMTALLVGAAFWLVTKRDA